MGYRLAKIYDIVVQKGGTNARMQLAKESGISRKKAGEIEDTPELVKKLKRLASNILGKELG